ncbi:hypothetical protein C8N31_10333 [Sulfitobacter mediterraneus]|uniref:Uncharacterized protein n=2 Tax=Sulfitobacter mediterraneus TaxID=83219 RepID=A0A2T6CGC2_9RHOB|nr:hypothetical protein C8N31_10333 [Sulfitobacter mediterraneus]
MVCVVTAASGHVFVATSGSGDSMIGTKTVPDFLTKANWWGDLDEDKMGKKKFQKATRYARDVGSDDAETAERGREAVSLLAKHKLATEAPARSSPVGLGVASAAIANNLTAPDYAYSKPGSSVIYNTSGGRRDCAEPRALELAGNAGGKITGMTTIWHGSPDHKNYRGYVDDRKFADVTINAAKPCDFCVANEARVMAEVARATTQPIGTLRRRHSIG